MTRARLLRFLVSACLLVAAPAGAQSGRDQLVPAVTFGWNGLVPTECWTPITVHLTAGERAVSGYIIIEHAQDPTQGAQITVPFSATPNATTPVQVVTCLPQSCDRIDLTIVTDDRRRIRQTYSATVSRDTLPLPPLLAPSHAVLACVGRMTLPESVRDWELFAGSAVRRNEEPMVLEPPWGQLSAALQEAQSLPTAAAAYDGLAALVVMADASRGADPRALEAVHEWVLSGGRLVVIADVPGESWRAWVPASGAASVTADAPTTHPLPPSISEAISTFASDLASPTPAFDRIEALRKKKPVSPYYGGQQPRPQPKPSANPELPAPAERVAGRGFQLTAEGGRLGWTLGWKPSSESASGLLAEGPAGFGHVTLLGIDPARTTSVLSARGAGAVWRQALRPALADFLEHTAWDDEQGYWPWYRSVTPSQSAINSSLESLAKVPGVGGWIVLAFAAGLGVLVLLIGPVDYFILKRRQRGQFWWVTALGWIGLASAGAWAAPNLIRTHPTQLTRLSVVDGFAASAGPQGLAFQTALSAVYAGQSGVITPSADPASWWRGAGGVFYWYRPERGHGTAPTLQAAAGGAAGSRRGNPLQGFSMPLWTFRAFLDQSREVSPLSARVRVTEGACRAVITGLPQQCRVDFAEVRLGAHRYSSADDSADQTAFVPAPAQPVGQVDGGAWEADLPERSGPGTVWTYSPRLHLAPGQVEATTVMPWGPGAALALPGPARRNQTIERLVATGRFAAVQLQVRGWPPELALNPPAQSEHTRVLRILVPVE